MPGSKQPQTDQPLRFLTLEQAAEVLSVSMSQMYALVRSGDLPAIKVGGRGQWRVEGSTLDTWIAEKYTQTRQFVKENPLGGQRAQP